MPGLQVKSVKEVNVLPIYITWTAGVPEWFVQNTISGIKRLIKVAGISTKIVTQKDMVRLKRLHPTAQYYQNQTLIRLNHVNHTQADAQQLITILSQEQFRQNNPHIDILIVDRDLNAKETDRNGQSSWLNFIYGLGGQAGIILSSYQYVKARTSLNFKKLLRSDPKIFSRLVRRLAAHELGHTLGLVSKQSHMDKRSGLYRHHCRNTCIMQQSVSMVDSINKMLASEKKQVFLCKACLKELHQRR